MKCKLQFLIITLSLMYCATAVADDMKVLSVRGKVALANSKGNSTLKPGMKLSASDKISVPDKAMLTLLHSGGRSIDVKTSGSYKVSDLMAQASSKGSGVAKKFASYVYSELTDTDDSPLSDSHKKNMSVAGSVERAQGDRQTNVDALEDLLRSTGAVNSSASLDGGLKKSAESLLSNDFITIILPRSSYLLEPKVLLRWNKLAAAKDYSVDIVDASDNVVFHKQTSDTSLSLDINDARMQTAKNYYWCVKRADKESVRSTQYCLQFCSEEHARLVQDTLSMIQSEVGEGSAFAKILQAQFAEDNALHMVAIDNYNKAVKMSATEDYKRYFRNYLRRLALFNDAQRVK